MAKWQPGGIDRIKRHRIRKAKASREYSCASHQFEHGFLIRARRAGKVRIRKSLTPSDAKTGGVSLPCQPLALFD